MNETKFRSEMHRAQAMQKTCSPEMSDYWAFYQRGIRRQYHGENFGTPEEHDRLLAMDDMRGIGYRDGFNFSTTMGRPSVGGIVLPQLTVDEDLRAALEAKAAASGLTMPDARREAYRMYVAR